jgi:LL-diaminopimelate aminotransferase
MTAINENFQKLPGSYLFSEIARRVAAYEQEHPDKKLIRLGIGDVTRPLPEAVTAAMHRAVDDMATAGGFHGYGPEQGYDFLREAIARCDYQAGNGTSSPVRSSSPTGPRATAATSWTCLHGKTG